MASSPPGPLVRLMVVDDQDEVRFLVRAYVEDAGVEVVAEADGVETALERLHDSAPDVVLLDARMPRVDGFEAAPLLLARRPELKIVLLSALVDDQVRARAREAGIAECLSKDDFDRVAAVVRALAVGGSAPSPPPDG